MLEGLVIDTMNDNEMMVRILEAVSDVKSSVAGLRSDVSYLRQRMDDLWTKVEEVEHTKAEKVDLDALSGRIGALEQLKWQAMGAGAVMTAVASMIVWALHEFASKIH